MTTIKRTICPGHKDWRPDTMEKCLADLMASNGKNPCPVCGLPRKVTR